MATTNLISKSLGDVLTESGNGVPDHTSPLGSLYTDKDSGLLYQNSDGVNSWFIMSTVAYGEGTYKDNTTQTSLSINTWTAVGNTLVEGVVVGFSGGTEHLTLLSGYDGKYDVRGDVTLDFVAGTNNYEVGISHNDIPPNGGTYNSTFLTSTYSKQHVGVEQILDLVGGDTLSFDVQNVTSSDNVIVVHAQLFARKIS